MIPRFQPTIGHREIAALVRAGAPDAVAEYEAAFAKAMNQSFGVAFPYGRTALRILLETWGLEAAEIICPAYTCVVVPHAVVTSGNRPVFVDSQQDANMNLAAAERAITRNTRALIATSIFGHPINLDEFDQLKRRHPGLLIVQDCAHSFSCEWNGRPVQSSGDAAIYGCNISKIATSVFGGMITTDDPELAARIRQQRNKRLEPASLWKSILRGLYLPAAGLAFTPALYSLIDVLRRTGALSGLEDYYDPNAIDMPDDHLVALTQLEARVGAVQSKRIHEFIAARRKYAELYRELLAGLPSIEFLPSPAGSSFSHIAAIVQNPAEAIAAAKCRGIELGRIIDYSCPQMPCYAPLAGSGEWPMAAFFAKHVINLPVSGKFNANRTTKVATALHRAFADLNPAPAIPEIRT